VISFSQAILIGSQLRHKSINDYYDEHGGSCALCAAGEGIFGKQKPTTESAVKFYEFFKRHYKATLWQTLKCPECDKQGLAIDIIHHLNDWHHWNRECIAHWIRNFEQECAELLVA
jgi:hypothetical protein